jgi:hypothetical protein
MNQENENQENANQGLKRKLDEHDAELLGARRTLQEHEIRLRAIENANNSGFGRYDMQLNFFDESPYAFQSEVLYLKDNLDNFKRRVKDGFYAVNGNMQHNFNRLHAQSVEARGALHKEMAEVRTELSEVRAMLQKITQHQFLGASGGGGSDGGGGGGGSGVPAALRRMASTRPPLGGNPQLRRPYLLARCGAGGTLGIAPPSMCTAALACGLRALCNRHDLLGRIGRTRRREIASKSRRPGLAARSRPPALASASAAREPVTQRHSDSLPQTAAVPSPISITHSLTSAHTSDITHSL